MAIHAQIFDDLLQKHILPPSCSHCALLVSQGVIGHSIMLFLLPPSCSHCALLVSQGVMGHSIMLFLLPPSCSHCALLVSQGVTGHSMLFLLPPSCSHCALLVSQGDSGHACGALFLLPPWRDDAGPGGGLRPGGWGGARAGCGGEADRHRVQVLLPQCGGCGVPPAGAVLAGVHKLPRPHRIPRLHPRAARGWRQGLQQAHHLHQPLPPTQDLQGEWFR